MNGSKLLVILSLLALASCAKESSPSSARWVAGSSIGKLDLLAVDLIDELRGWAAGDIDPGGKGGVIYATSDGGLSWQPVAATPEVLASIFFVSPQRGWVAGYAGRIERTDDGGRTWKPQRVERQGEVINSIFFIDEHRGWAAGGAAGAGGLLLRTTNGGETWEQIETGRVEAFWSVRFLGPDRGWAVGEDGIIVATSDGGSSWTKQNGGTSRVLLGLAISPSGKMVAVGEAGTILHSEDGMSWAAVRSPTTETLNAVAAAGDVFWAVGSKGATLSSRDGGRGWAMAQAVSSRDLTAIDLATPTRGIAVGKRGSSQLLQ
ncbi:MAG: YCF48-related protein [Acidobacteriota bacterium]